MRVAMRKSRGGWRATWLVAPAAVAALVAASVPAGAASRPVETPFTPVVQQVLRGDLVMAANSNLLSAGGWRPDGRARADVDGDATQLCVGRTFVPAACADNSSSADLAIPAGARGGAAPLCVDKAR